MEIPPEVITVLGWLGWGLAIASTVILFGAWLGHFFGGWFERQ
jgi:hypothetical protein